MEIQNGNTHNFLPEFLVNQKKKKKKKKKERNKKEKKKKKKNQICLNFCNSLPGSVVYDKKTRQKAKIS